MEIEEGVHVTEQVIELLDQFIKQGKELHILDNTTTSLERQHQQEHHVDEFVGYGKITTSSRYFIVIISPSLARNIKWHI